MLYAWCRTLLAIENKMGLKPDTLPCPHDAKDDLSEILIFSSMDPIHVAAGVNRIDKAELGSVLGHCSFKPDLRPGVDHQWHNFTKVMWVKRLDDRQRLPISLDVSSKASDTHRGTLDPILRGALTWSRSRGGSNIMTMRNHKEIESVERRMASATLSYKSSKK
jgi:hypothetical protein